MGPQLFSHLVLALLCVVRAAAGSPNNWAVIISSSRYWLNYRHSSNALGVYQAVRRLGIPDGNIILMLAEQPACSPRNVHPGQLYLAPGAATAAGGGTSIDAGPSDILNLLSGDVEVDYRGREVSVDSVLRVLTGHHPPGTPASKRLRSGPSSRVLIYLTGHGGDEFLKFHDEEELLAADIATAVHQMAAAGRYGEMLLLADTCQASTLYSRITEMAPNVLAVASSKLGQSSYAHHVDPVVGQHVVDQLSYHLHQFLWRLPLHTAISQAVHAANSSIGMNKSGSSGAGQPAPSLQQMLDYISGQRLSSDIQVRTDLSRRLPTNIPVTDFFGMEAVPLSAAWAKAAAAEEARANGEISHAVESLLQLARQAPSAAAKLGCCFQPLQHRRMPLYQLLEVAASSTLHKMEGRNAKAVTVVAAWAAAVALSRLLLQS